MRASDRPSDPPVAANIDDDRLCVCTSDGAGSVVRLDAIDVAAVLVLEPVVGIPEVVSHAKELPAEDEAELGGIGEGERVLGGLATIIMLFRSSGWNSPFLVLFRSFISSAS